MQFDNKNLQLKISKDFFYFSLYYKYLISDIEMIWYFLQYVFFQDQTFKLAWSSMYDNEAPQTGVFKNE